MAHGLSCSAACGIFPDQASNPCPLHWQVDSQPLRHQEVPCPFLLTQFFFLFWPRPTIWEILVPPPGMEPVLSAVEVQSPDHWTGREVPRLTFDLAYKLCSPSVCVRGKGNAGLAFRFLGQNLTLSGTSLAPRCPLL